MRVGVVSDMIRPNGAGVMALLGAELLSDAGHEVVLIAAAAQPTFVHEFGDSMFGAANFSNDERALDRSVTQADHQGLQRSFLGWLMDRIGEWEIDLVYVHNCGRTLSQLDLADMSRLIPVAHTMHDEWFYSDAHYTFTSPSGEVVRTYEPATAEEVLAHRYEELFDVPNRMGNFVGIGPSNWLTERARRVFPTIRFEHLPNPVDGEFFALQDRSAARAELGLPEDAAIALFVGNPTQERKGFRSYEHGVREASRILGRPILRLVAGGAGSVVTGGATTQLLAGPIAELVRRPTLNPIGSLGIDGPGIVLSGLDRSRIPALYGAADVLVHPSLMDNLPTVPIEAGLTGTRCLASDVGGTRETIADLDDLFDPHLAAIPLGERIADAISSAATETAHDRQRRRDRQIDRFSPQTHIEQLVPLLEELVSDSRHG